MISVLKLGTVVTLLLVTVFCVQFWPYRRSLLTKLYSMNLFMVCLWAFWVILTLITPDEGLKILFTKARQVTNPFMAAGWFVVFLLIFFREKWDRFKKYLPLMFILPAITSVSTVLSIMGSRYFEYLVAHSFTPLVQEAGLMGYVAGPILRWQFQYAAIIMLVMFAIFILKMFSEDRSIRRLAFLFFSSSCIQILFELFSHSRMGGQVFVQMSVVGYIPVVATLYYAIHKMEFLNIKAQANQAAFDDLPIPVMTINPRGEIWDANKKAFELIKLTGEDIGRPIAGDPRFEFISSRRRTVILEEAEHQVEIRELQNSSRTQGVRVVSLTDVSEIHRLNKELAEGNQILSRMNSEILKMTTFNRRIHTVLSHDLSGLLHSMSSSLSHLFDRGALGQGDRALGEAVLRTNRSSVELLKSILAWSHDETDETIHVGDLIQDVLKAQGVLQNEFQVRVEVDVAPDLVPMKTSVRMMEAVLRNLVSNAIRHTPNQGLVKITAWPEGSGLRISIVDEGPGIAPETLERVLKQQTLTSKDRFGFGIGMHFTLDFVRQLDGQIRFERGPRFGTRVELTFPLK